MIASVASVVVETADLVLETMKRNTLVDNLALAIKSAQLEKVSDADLGALVRILLRLSARSESPSASKPNTTDVGAGAAGPAAAASRLRPKPAPAPPAKRKNGAAGDGQRAGGRRVNYDDRVKIKARYAEHMQGRQRPERGFVLGLATEFGCSDATVYAILKE
jgi:hypothetical protein